MAPKRQRSKGSSSTRAYDRRRFVSAEAADKYDTYLAGKALTPERGLRPDAFLDGEMAHQINERGWSTFTQQPEPAVIAIVQEFYANVEDKPPYEVMVRGKTVSFSGSTINAYYNLIPPEYCQYAQYAAQNPDLDKIVKDLCKPGSAWTSKGPRGAMYFPSKDLSKYGRVWYAFLCAKLMPSQHVSDVGIEKAPLLYAIVTDMKINVGDVIERSIRRSVKQPTQGGLPHPSLICGLCYRAGVRWGADEGVKQPMTVLDHGLIERYKVGQGESHPRGVGFILPDHPLQSDDVSGSSEQGATNEGSRRAIRRLRRQMESQFDVMVRLNERIAERQEVMHAYSYSCTSSLAAMFAQMHPGAAFQQIPPPPPLPGYPPSESDEDNDAEEADGNAVDVDD